MKKTWLSMVMIVLLCFQNVYGELQMVNSKEELTQTLINKILEKEESFRIRYQGSEDLSQADLGVEVYQTFGTQQNSYVTSVLGLDGFSYKGQYYGTGKTITYDFTMNYAYNAAENAQLQEDLKVWVAQNISRDMPDVIKCAVISKYLCDRLQYKIDVGLNDSYHGYYSKATACNGYAGLTWYMLQLAGVPVHVVSGYSPDKVSESQMLSKNYTADQLEAIANQYRGSNVTETELHAWNMVQIDGRWYHLDNTWIDLEASDPQKSPYNALYFLGGDDDFARSRAWVRSEYPASATNWWDGTSGETKEFLKSYFKTQIYDYPVPKDVTELENYIQAACDNGESAQKFRVNQGLVPYNVFPDIRTAKLLANGSFAEYLAPPVAKDDRYILTLSYRGRKATDKMLLNSYQKQISTMRGEQIDLTDIVPQNSIEEKNMKMISLTPGMIANQSDGTVKGVAEGKGFIGVYTPDDAVVVAVDIKPNDLSLMVNDKILELKDPPKNIRGRVLVPLRGLMEAMGADVRYDGNTRQIFANRGEANLILRIDDVQAVVNGEETMLDVAPTLIEDRTYVPARVVAECLGAEVLWNAEKNRVEIRDEAYENKGDETSMENDEQ